jgi:hypothetical protein
VYVPSQNPLQWSGCSNLLTSTHLLSLWSHYQVGAIMNLSY